MDRRAFVQVCTMLGWDCPSLAAGCLKIRRSRQPRSTAETGAS